MKNLNISHITIDDNHNKPHREREREAVSQLLAAINQSYKLGHRSDGSPIIDDHPEITLSITHSTITAAVALSTTPNTLLGIDLESPRKALLRTRDRWANPKDVTYTANKYIDVDLPDNQTLEEYLHQEHLYTLLKLWTAKEAAYKAYAPHHPGQRIFLSDIAVDLNSSTATLPDGTSLALSFQAIPPDQIMAIAFS